MDTPTKIGLAFLVTLQLCGEGELPKPTRVVPMDYPRLAHMARVQGTVELQAQVSTDGGVLSVTPKSGHNLLIPPAQASLREWRFTRCSGEPGACVVVVKFVFIIRGECPDKCESEFIVDGPYQVTVRAKGLIPIVD